MAHVFEVGEVSGMLGEVVAAVDAGELTAPVWLRDRLRAAQVALDAVRPPVSAQGPQVERVAA